MEKINSLHKPERNAQVITLYKSGKSVTEIAKQFGIRYQRVQTILAQSGIEPKTRRYYKSARLIDELEAK